MMHGDTNIKLESNSEERNFSVKNNPQLEYNYSDIGGKKTTILNKKCNCKLLYLKRKTVKKVRFRCSLQSTRLNATI
jgi:hypothetical protein